MYNFSLSYFSISTLTLATAGIISEVYNCLIVLLLVLVNYNNTEI